MRDTLRGNTIVICQKSREGIKRIYCERESSVSRFAKALRHNHIFVGSNISFIKFFSSLLKYHNFSNNYKTSNLAHGVLGFWGFGVLFF